MVFLEKQYGIIIREHAEHFCRIRYVGNFNGLRFFLPFLRRQKQICRAGKNSNHRGSAGIRGKRKPLKCSHALESLFALENRQSDIKKRCKHSKFIPLSLILIMCLFAILQHCQFFIRKLFHFLNGNVYTVTGCWREKRLELYKILAVCLESGDFVL